MDKTLGFHGSLIEMNGNWESKGFEERYQLINVYSMYRKTACTKLKFIENPLKRM